jgi:putative ABC transport system permease protein
MLLAHLSEPQAPSYNSVVYLRTAADPGTLSEAIRREVQAVDQTIPVFGIQTMDEVVARSLAARRFALEILGIFAIVAFLLACVGIYGVMAYAISQRTGEIGLRMALGARRGDILRVVLNEAALIVIAGVGAGLLGSLLLTRFLQNLLFDIKPTDPLTFGALTILLAGVALLASFIPARRASRIDPLIAMRHE